MRLKEKYKHFEELHELYAPSKIVPVIQQIVNPNSIVDVGCGLGTFLRIFREKGVRNILGIDGEWCNRELLFKNISEQEFMESDLEQQIKSDQNFDLVICLEVAEHLSPARANSFVEDLVSLGNVILFSAAIPGSGGINHINEQWPEYWEEKFKKLGYIKHDILKEYFWNDPGIWWWYKQNMVLYTRENYSFENRLSLTYNNLNNAIHPQLYTSKINLINKIIRGRASVFYYIKLLIKAILYRLKFYR